MKKYLFDWMTIVLMVFVCVGFSACGDDDDDGGNINANKLVGIWKCTYNYEQTMAQNEYGDWYLSSEKENTFDENEASVGLLIEKEGKMRYLNNVLSKDSYDVEVENVQYKVEDGHLYILDSDENDWVEWEITISGNTLEIIKEDDLNEVYDYAEIIKRKYIKL